MFENHTYENSYDLPVVYLISYICLSYITVLCFITTDSTALCLEIENAFTLFYFFI